MIYYYPLSYRAISSLFLLEHFGSAPLLAEIEKEFPSSDSLMPVTIYDKVLSIVSKHIGKDSKDEVEKLDRAFKQIMANPEVRAISIIIARTLNLNLVSFPAKLKVSEECKRSSYLQKILTQIFFETIRDSTGISTEMLETECTHMLTKHYESLGIELVWDTTIECPIEL